MKTTNDGKKGGLLKGKSHDDGGIQAVVVDTGQPVELEGDEVIINKKSMNDDREFTVTGTPKEIASAINSIDDNGVKFDEGAVLENHETGEIKKMERGGFFEKNFDKDHLWFLYWYE